MSAVPEPLIALVCRLRGDRPGRPRRSGCPVPCCSCPCSSTLLKVPNPSVTPTNLLYNVVAGPGALRPAPGPASAVRSSAGCSRGTAARAWWWAPASGSGWSPTPARSGWSRPSVLLGPGRLAGGAHAAAGTETTAAPRPATPALVALAFAVGVLGGVYGIGGGSILAPVLVGRGMRVAEVAPAALASTFVTSLVGAASFAVIALGADGSVAPGLDAGRRRRARRPGRRLLGCRGSHRACPRRRCGSCSAHLASCWRRRTSWWRPDVSVP